MATANLSRKNEIGGFDSIIIVKDLSDIPGGVTLDVTAVTDTVVKAGHVLVEKGGVVKPLAISGGSYAALASEESYYGILKAAVSTSNPQAAVLRIGTVNAKAAAANVGAPYTSAITTALKNIDFIY